MNAVMSLSCSTGTINFRYDTRCPSRYVCVCKLYSVSLSIVRSLCLFLHFAVGAEAQLFRGWSESVDESTAI